MAAGCRGGFPSDAYPHVRRQRAVRAGRRAAVVCLGVALAAGGALLAAGKHVAAGVVNTAFNGSFALPNGVGASQPQVLIDSAGAILVVGSSGAGLGCPTVSLSHDGSKATYLGRPGTGVNCSVSAGPLQLTGSPLAATGNLAVASLSPDGSATGRSQDGGASFTWSRASGPSAMPDIVSDPAVNAAGLSTTFVLVRDATTAVPRVAVSMDGGLTYTLGDSLINALDIAPGLWQGAGPGPVVGNLVVHRTDTGLTLFSIIATADSAADRTAQAAAGTANLNRVYTAIGTVSQTTVLAPPTVAWHDVEAYHAPAGTALNRALPEVSADSAGHVYVAFADGRHVFVKSDFDGTKWDPAAAPVTVDSIATGLPGGVNAALLPSIASGANGKVDLAWYGATGGSATSADPASDGANSWAVYMAQTIDGGKSWTAYAVSDHEVHHGALKTSAPAPGDALAIAVDQVSGAAAVAYADDQTVPGTPSLFATRQCTGLSALTGVSLVNDCVAPQPATPVLPGSTCPGPQITALAGDALDNSPTGGGHNIYYLDLVGGGLRSVDAGNEQASLVVNRAQTELSNGIAKAWWRLYWTYKDAAYYAEVSIVAGQLPAYSVGTVNKDGSLSAGQTVAGLITLGNAGSFALTIPLSLIGSPPAGATLSNLHAATYAQYSAPGASALPVTLIDVAPTTGMGADYVIGGACAPALLLPEVPVAVLLPAIGGVVAVLVTFVRRRRSRQAAIERPSDDVSANSSGGLP
jgi:hypothetical protein